MRIVSTPDTLHGTLRFNGTRIPIYIVLQLLGEEYSIEDIIALYPSITRQDILDTLHYCAMVLGAKQTEEGDNANLQPDGPNKPNAEALR
jgi:uncharacterized protein (DUF433 family)